MPHCHLHSHYNPDCDECRRKRRTHEDEETARRNNQVLDTQIGQEHPSDHYAVPTDSGPNVADTSTSGFSGGGGDSSGGGASGSW